MSADSIVAARTWSGGSDDSDDSVVPLFVKITSVPGRGRRSDCATLQTLQSQDHEASDSVDNISPLNTCGTVITFTSEH